MTTNDPAVCDVTVAGDTTPPLVLYTEQRIMELAVTKALLIVVLEADDASEIPKNPTFAPEPFAGEPRPNILWGINDISTYVYFLR